MHIGDEAVAMDTTAQKVMYFHPWRPTPGRVAELREESSRDRGPNELHPEPRS